MQGYFPHTHQHAIQAIRLRLRLGVFSRISALRDALLRLPDAMHSGREKLPNRAVVLLPGAPPNNPPLIELITCRTAPHRTATSLQHR